MNAWTRYSETPPSWWLALSERDRRAIAREEEAETRERLEADARATIRRRVDRELADTIEDALRAESLPRSSEGSRRRRQIRAAAMQRFNASRVVMGPPDTSDGVPISGSAPREVILAEPDPGLCRWCWRTERRGRALLCQPCTMWRRRHDGRFPDEGSLEARAERGLRAT